jgi:hypothetical protein
MVTLRDGKRYDVGAAASASSDDYPELVRPRRRASTGISSAQQRRSRRSAVAELYLAYESEPPSPAATPRRSKRGRAEPLMVTQQLQDDDDDSGMDTGKVCLPDLLIFCRCIGQQHAGSVGVVPKSAALATGICGTCSQPTAHRW